MLLISLSVYVMNSQKTFLSSAFLYQNVCTLENCQILFNFLLFKKRCIQFYLLIWLHWVFAAEAGFLYALRLQWLWHTDQFALWAQLSGGMWNLPGPGIEPMTLALASRFLTTGPPRKSSKSSNFLLKRATALYTCTQMGKNDCLLTRSQSQTSPNFQIFARLVVKLDFIFILEGV